MTAKQPVMVVFFTKSVTARNRKYSCIDVTFNNLLKIKIENRHKIEIDQLHKILFNSHLCKLSRRYSPTPPEPSTTTLNSLMLLSSCIFFFCVIKN